MAIHAKGNWWISKFEEAFQYLNYLWKSLPITDPPPEWPVEPQDSEVLPFNWLGSASQLVVVNFLKNYSKEYHHISSIRL